MTNWAVDNLSERERESLEGVLAHKTAKEIARDLEISHHAVEKRLKRARDKLGVATSLEAARAYAAHYGTTVSGLSDLSLARQKMQSGATAGSNNSRLLQTGGSLAMFSSIILAATLLQAAPAPSDVEPDAFAGLDKNRSGFIEKSEFLMPLSFAFRFTMNDSGEESSATLTHAKTAELAGETFDQKDTDGDGKLTRAEFGSGTILMRRIAPAKEQ